MEGSEQVQKLHELAVPAEESSGQAAPTLIFPPDYPAEMTLAACPVGLFLYRDELCLKTEYRTEKGAVEAYIAASGEFFWGDQPQTVESQLGQIVRPIEVASSSPARSVEAPRLITHGYSEELRERLELIAQQQTGSTNLSGEIVSFKEIIRRAARQIARFTEPLPTPSKAEGE